MFQMFPVNNHKWNSTAVQRTVVSFYPSQTSFKVTRFKQHLRTSTHTHEAFQIHRADDIWQLSSWQTALHCLAWFCFWTIRTNTKQHCCSRPICRQNSRNTFNMNAVRTFFLKRNKSWNFSSCFLYISNSFSNISNKFEDLLKKNRAVYLKNFAIFWMVSW